MTVTLRCTHCQQVMTIAPRKPGSRVNCPGCGSDVVVPASSDRIAVVPAASAASEAAGARGTAVASPPVAKRGERPARPAAEPRVAAEPTPTAVRSLAGSRSADADSLPPADLANLVVLPKSVLVLSLIIALVAIVSAFLAGFLFGKYL